MRFYKAFLAVALMALIPSVSYAADSNTVVTDKTPPTASAPSIVLVRESVDKNDSKVRKMITDSSTRFDARRETLRDEMRELGKRVDGKIKKALENPLAGLRK